MIPEYPRPRREFHAALVATLPDGQKVKQRVPRMRACDEKNVKGKICAGHIKRWYDADGALIGRFGEELYRCERCRTIYLPHPGEAPRTGTLSW